MMREVNLTSYLPLFMQKYQEPMAALEAENDEFNIIWNATEKVLYNRFIATADEDGISRYEKLLGILPSLEDNLESRRLKIQLKWFGGLPYTVRVLLQKMIILCGNTDFSLTDNFTKGYTLTIKTNLEEFGKVRELEDIFTKIIPLNIVIESNNEIAIEADGSNYIAGGISYGEIITISN